VYQRAQATSLEERVLGTAVSHTARTVVLDHHDAVPMAQTESMVAVV